MTLCQTASRPYRLSYVNAFRINQFYKPKDQSVKFLRKNFENWRFWKTSILKNRPFWFFFPWKKNCFCLILMKISPNLYGKMDGSKFWCFHWFSLLLSLVFSKFLAMRNIMLYSAVYSKHWIYTVAHIIDSVCSKTLIHSLNHGLFLSLFKFIRCWNVPTNPITITRIFPHWPMEQIQIDRSTPSYRPIGIKIGL